MDEAETRRLLEAAAGRATGLNAAEREEAVRILLKQVTPTPDVSLFSAPPEKPEDSMKFGLGFGAPLNRTFSAKAANLRLSWKDVLLRSGGTSFSATASALTVMCILAKGFVHVFDEIDARILRIIHEALAADRSALPTETGAFYDQQAARFPPTINRALFMERVVRLAETGAVSIDGDILKITERFVWL